MPKSVIAGAYPKGCATGLKDMLKADLHVHLSGAIPINSINEIIQKHDVDIPNNFDLEKDLIIKEPVTTLLDYFKPWFLLKRLPKGKSCLRDMIFSAASSMANERVQYAELRHSINSISENNSIRINQALEWLIEELEDASQKCNIDLRLVVSISRYNLTEENAWNIFKAVKEVDHKNRIVAFDLTGNENIEVPTNIFKVFREAKDDLGLGVTIHAGETGNVANIVWALDVCHADRIGHGLAASKSPSLMERLLKDDICLEICLTSSLKTGSVKYMEEHPLIKFIENKLPFVLCSDNPAINCSSLTDEYRFFAEAFNRPDLIEEMYNRQVKYAFSGVNNNGK